MVTIVEYGDVHQSIRVGRMGARLVGIGPATKGIEHPLMPGEIVVIGRQNDCTIPLTRTVVDGETGLVSRQHAVLEEVAPGCWCVYDTGSVNGSSVLRAGLPPAQALALGERFVLSHEDVIELAGSQSFQFAYHDSGGDGEPSVAIDRTMPWRWSTAIPPSHELPRPLSDLLLDAAQITIGTASDNTCRLIDPTVSRHHAIVWRSDRDLFLRDLDSLNGTTINGVPLAGTASLAPDARVSLGRLQFVVDPACWERQTERPSVDLRLVDVSVTVAGRSRLHHVSFGVHRGQMIGLLGPSASGKSTLLKALAGRLRIASGALYINGRRMDAPNARWGWLTSLMGTTTDDHSVGFVQQHDLVQPGLTVREIFQFAARQMGLDTDEAASRAAEAGTRCNLLPLLDRVVQSSDGRLNLSGGQLKRVCVGIEVLRQPRILLLDEPTTGQDPKNTRDQMEVFLSLSRGGATTILSTHDLHNLEMFDAIGVLCLGHLVYFGPPASFAAHFGAASPEAVYRSLPDREELSRDAETLGDRFRRTPLYEQHCQVDA